MNVLSLFDGMSCGQIALRKLGIKVDNYFASEVDKYAIKVSSENFPNTIHLGDVTKIDFKALPKIDLLIGGSPCQGFSFAGKQLNFNDPRSALFFEFVRALKESNPKYFMLENVLMKKEYQEVISEQLGTSPIFINSSVLSAQNRKRLYWTNIPVSEILKKEIYLKDILEKNVPEKYYLSEKLVQGLLDKKSSWKNSFNPLTGNDKSKCLTARYYKQAASDPYILEKPFRIGDIDNGGQGNRVYSSDAKSVCLSAVGGGRGAKTWLYFIEQTIRRLTPLECKRLQTVPDDYRMSVSDSQAYKMLGNGWTVDVIAHIFGGIK